MNASKRWWDTTSVVILICLLVTVGRRLETTYWVEYLDKATWLIILAGFSGLAIGYSKFSKRIAWLFTVSFSLFAIPWQLGLIIEGNIAWTERLVSVAGRLNNTLTLFLSNSKIEDPILFLTQMYILWWLIGLVGSYQMVRYGRGWISIVLCLLAVVIVEVFSPYNRQPFYSGAAVFFGLLLAGRMFFLHARENWENERIAVDAETGYDLSRSMIIGGLVLVLLAWNMPTIIEAYRPGTLENQRFQELGGKIRERFENLFAALQSRAPVVESVYMDDLELDTGQPVSNEEVFWVRASRPPEMGERYYWRVRVYDQYYFGKWSISRLAPRPVEPGEEILAYLDIPGQEKVDFTFTLQSDAISQIYMPGRPITVSRPANAMLTDSSEDDLPEVVLINSKVPIRSGETFRVTSWLLNPTVEDLRAAGDTYPDWIKERYLQIPNGFSPQVQELAVRITQGKTNAYDKAVAITNYLRAQIVYTDTVPKPPSNRDPIEWFLIQLRQGFCKYYASAEVMMLRSVGIPARLAVGYAQGVSSDNNQQFQVRIKEAHAWPEVYFPNLGWIEFEPTTALPSLDRRFAVTGSSSSNIPGYLNPRGPLQENNLGEKRAEQYDKDEIITPAKPSGFPVWAWIAVGFGLVGLSLGGFLFYTRRKSTNMQITPLPVLLQREFRRRGWHVPDWLQAWAFRTGLSPVERFFSRVSLMLRLLGEKTSPSQTPFEQVSLLIRKLPASETAALSLLDEYQQEIYGPSEADSQKAKAALSELWRLLIKSWLSRFVEEE